MFRYFDENAEAKVCQDIVLKALSESWGVNDQVLNFISSSALL